MERLQGKESSTLNPTIKAIMKLVALALLATFAKGCDKENPDEAILQTIGGIKINAKTHNENNPDEAILRTIESAKSGTLTMVKEICASTAAEEAGIRAGTESLSDSARLDLEEVLTEQCLDEHGVVVTP